MPRDKLTALFYGEMDGKTEMKRLTFGVFAHVDAGKTTFSEELLYRVGAIRRKGRVDHGDTLLDTDEIERKRGITVFANQATFTYEASHYTLIDTPGHLDFSAEAERMLSVLDAAILVISASEGVQAHTLTLFHLLVNAGIPLFVFINKCDTVLALDSLYFELADKLSDDLLVIDNKASREEWLMNEEALLFLADRDDDFMLKYLEENATLKEKIAGFRALIGNQQLIPVMAGSALKGEGIEEFWRYFDWLVQTNYDDQADKPFAGCVYKIRYDEKQTRITYIKALSGKLRPRDDLVTKKNGEIHAEKVNELRFYNGDNYTQVEEVQAGDVFGITGLKYPEYGTTFGYEDSRAMMHFKPAFQAEIHFPDGTDKNTILKILRILEAEEPGYAVEYDHARDLIFVSVLGQMQLEVLSQLVENRYGIKVQLTRPKILYKETIANPVMGYGHFEPLRHYSEVTLRLEPLPRGSGVVFHSECSVDMLESNYQNAISRSVFEKEHRGVLIGSPLTDVAIILVHGRSHTKHTEGGDFQESTCRAIRQGLMGAESMLLEPYYHFDFFIPTEFLGRLFSDIQMNDGEFSLESDTGTLAHVSGRGPVQTFGEYQQELLAYTKGNGSVSFVFDGYDDCHNPEEIITAAGYDPVTDVDNPTHSVFCSHGAGFTVPWDQVPDMMHTLITL